MTSWAPISAMPSAWRRLFIELAQEGLIRTRAAYIHADQRDPAVVSAIRLAYYHEYRGRFSSDVEEEMRIALLSVPIVRNHDVPLEMIWAHAHGDAIHWDTSTFVHGDGPGSLETFASGLEFDIASAAKILGLEAKRAKRVRGNAAKSDRGRARRLGAAIADAARPNRRS